MSDDPQDKQEQQPAINATDLLLSFPLYSELVAPDQLLKKLRYDGLQFDGHCVECGKESTFKTLEIMKQKVPESLISVTKSTSPPAYLQQGTFSVTAICQRNGRHLYSYYFRLRTGKVLVKIGQDPSLEDVTGADLERFRTILDKGRFGELRRATGLASHGIGIGAFVYLRRIFEGLIHEHYQAAVSSGISIEGYDRMRMDEKVTSLSTVLPEAMVEHSAAYSILSAGIHQLDEETCREYFPVIRQAIIMVLEQDLRQKREAEDADRLRRDMSRILGKVRSEGKKSDHGRS